jgi:hypothetical protein
VLRQFPGEAVRRLHRRKAVTRGRSGESSGLLPLLDPHRAQDGLRGEDAQGDRGLWSILDAAVAAATLNVVNHTTSISVTVLGSLAEGSNATITASLMDDRGKPLAGADIAFSPNDTRIGDGTTDANGVAELTYIPLSSGHVQVRAAYDGEDFSALPSSPIPEIALPSPSPNPRNDVGPRPSTDVERTGSLSTQV